MTPEYIEQLADLVDPTELWRLPLFEQMDLPMDLRHLLDAGIALRRYASHQRRLVNALAEGRSLLVTPLSLSGTATKVVDTPDEHKRIGGGW